MKTAREIATDISEGKIPPQHIGKKSYAVIKQELFSLKNIDKAHLHGKEIEEWDKTMNGIVEAISKLGSEDQERLYDEVDKMLNP